MSIGARYPSRLQSHWDNPLFVRPRLRRLESIAVVALALAVIAVGVCCLNAGAQAHSAPKTPHITALA